MTLSLGHGRYSMEDNVLPVAFSNKKGKSMQKVNEFEVAQGQGKWRDSRGHASRFTARRCACAVCDVTVCLPVRE